MGPGSPRWSTDRGDGDWDVVRMVRTRTRDGVPEACTTRETDLPRGVGGGIGAADGVRDLTRKPRLESEVKEFSRGGVSGRVDSEWDVLGVDGG